MKMLAELRIISVFLMPNHLLRVLPFVGLSFLTLSTAKNVEETAEAVNGTVQQVDGNRESLSTTAPSSSASESATGNSSSDAQPHDDLRLEYDQRAAFVIDDDPSLGPEAFLATKSLCALVTRVVQRKPTEIAVREHGT